MSSFCLKLPYHYMYHNYMYMHTLCIPLLEYIVFSVAKL